MIRGKTYYLGKYGTPESRRLYRELVREHLSDTGRFAPPPAGDAPPTTSPAGPTLNEVVLGYLEHARLYYVSNPKEYEKVKLSTRPLRRLHGRTPVAAFDSLAGGCASRHGRLGAGPDHGERVSPGAQAAH